MADGWAGLKSGSRANRIFVVSDGTGRTADQALSAALVQFPGAPVEIIIRAKVRTMARAREVVREAAEAGGFIVHTIVTDGVREAIVRAGRERNVEMIDLMGPLIARLTETLAVSPAARPGLFAQLNKSYFRRIETMEFAFRHDDGQRVEDLRKAEILLLGVSRTFKTPLSIYFAFKGWFVANVPITLEHEPPAILAKLPPAGRAEADAPRLPQGRRRRIRRPGVRPHRIDARPSVLRAPSRLDGHQRDQQAHRGDRLGDPGRARHRRKAGPRGSLLGTGRPRPSGRAG